MRKLTSYFMVCVILLCLLPGQQVAAMTPIKEYRYEYSTPQDLVHWLTDGEWAGKQPYFNGDVYNKYRDAYWQKQGYIVVPRLKGETLDEVSWGGENVSVEYTYYNYWTMYVYPIKDVRNEEYFSPSITTLVEKKYHCSVPSESEVPIYGVYSDTPVGTEREHYKWKELRLGDNSVVTCVEHRLYQKDERGNLGQYDLHFIYEGMYVELITGYERDAKDPTLDLRNCTFEKIYMTPQLEHNKKNNKVTKKNAILYATMHNPANRKITDIKLYFYDKKKKKYKLQYYKKVSGKNRAKKKLAIKLNVKSCLKKGRKQLKRKQILKLKRKTKYKYMIRVRLSGKYPKTDKTSPNRQYYDVTGSFRLR